MENINLIYWIVGYQFTFEVHISEEELTKLCENIKKSNHFQITSYETDTSIFWAYADFEADEDGNYFWIEFAYKIKD